MTTTPDTLHLIRRTLVDAEDALGLALSFVDGIQDDRRRRDLRAEVVAAQDALHAAHDATLKP